MCKIIQLAVLAILLPSSSICKTIISTDISKFLQEQCKSYPTWVASFYPDPSLVLQTPLNFSVIEENAAVKASFSYYQMWGHSHPENWKLLNTTADLSSGHIKVAYELQNIGFRGYFSAHGMLNGTLAYGEGAWNITAAPNSHIIHTVSFSELKVTKDERFIDMSSAKFVSTYTYVDEAGREVVPDFNAIEVKGNLPESFIKEKLLPVQHKKSQQLTEHPLPIPLNAYLTALLMVTPISEMTTFNT